MCPLRHRPDIKYIFFGFPVHMFFIDSSADWLVQNLNIDILAVRTGGYEEMTNSALVYKPKCVGKGGSCGVSAVHSRSPNKRWRSNSIFNLAVAVGLPSRPSCWAPKSWSSKSGTDTPGRGQTVRQEPGTGRLGLRPKYFWRLKPNLRKVELYLQFILYANCDAILEQSLGK